MRKAITPVIAVVLLLMMTVAAAGAAFFWITTIQSRIQGQIGTQVGTTTTQTSTSLNMISIVCYNVTNSSVGLPSQLDDHDYLNITIQNTGSSTIEKGTSAITILDDKERVIKVATTELPSNFDQNQIMTLEVAILTSNSFAENSTYGVKLTLPGGVGGTSNCIAQNLTI